MNMRWEKIERAVMRYEKIGLQSVETKPLFRPVPVIRIRKLKMQKRLYFCVKFNSVIKKVKSTFQYSYFKLYMLWIKIFSDLITKLI